MQDALIVVDVQNDFCEGGALAAHDTESLVPDINSLIRRYVRENRLVIFTRDWHPEDHCSFEARGGPWPPHCVRGTPGAEFHPELEIPKAHLLVSKATEPDSEAYSGFDSTGLGGLLDGLDVQSVAICGLTTEYCVLNTFRDAREAGLEAVVRRNLVRPVKPGSEEEEEAFAEFES